MSDKIAWPWCARNFDTLSARYAHARASHVGKDMEKVCFDIVDGVQTPRVSGDMRSIAEIIAPIVERATR